MYHLVSFCITVLCHILLGPPLKKISFVFLKTVSLRLRCDHANLKLLQNAFKTIPLLASGCVILWTVTSATRWVSKYNAMVKPSNYMVPDGSFCVATEVYLQTYGTRVFPGSPVSTNPPLLNLETLLIGQSKLLHDDVGSLLSNDKCSL